MTEDISAINARPEPGRGESNGQTRLSRNDQAFHRRLGSI